MDRRTTLKLAMLGGLPATAAQAQGARPDRVSHAVVDLLDFAPPQEARRIAEGQSTFDLSGAFAAALAALPRSGGKILFSSTGRYFFSRPLSWEDRPLILEGCGTSVQPGVGTVLKFPPGVTGIHVRNGAKGLGAGSEVSRLVLDGSRGQARGAAPADGILIQANGVRVRDVMTHNFTRHGVHVLSALRDAQVDINANNWSLDRVRALDNGGSGLATAGVDSNAGSHRDCDFSGNDEFGWDENAFLNNAGYSPHFAGNRLGAMHFNAISRHTQAYAVYVEDDQTPALTVHRDSAGGHVVFFAQVANRVVDNTPEKNSLIYRKDGGPHFNRLAVGGANQTTITIEPQLMQLLAGAALRLGNRDGTMAWRVRAQGQDLVFDSGGPGALRIENALVISAPTFKDNVAAKAARLPPGAVYKTPDGGLRSVV